MHGFRDRPLTWLFVATTVCIDLVMILPTLFPVQISGSAQFINEAQFYNEAQIINEYVPRLIISIGVPAQLSLMALWAATSPATRLARGATLTAAVYLAFLSALLFGLPRQQVILYFFAPTLVVWGGALTLELAGLLPGWRPMDAATTSPQGTRALDSRLMKSLGLRISGRSQEERPWQFSLVELFGWTCVVALWAFAVRHADLAPYSWSWLARAVVAPLLMVVLLGGPGSWWVRAGCVLSIFVLLLLLARTNAGIHLLLAKHLILAQAAYLTLWYVVRRLDGALGTPWEKEV